MGLEGMTPRQWYAHDLKLRAPIRRNMAIVDAFAAVARERFLGPGPWRILSDSRYGPRDGEVTPDDDPHWICHDVLVSIDQARRLNNGLPSFWAYNLDCLDLKRGERVMQVGAGTGYYAAIVAEIVGRSGRVIAVEYDDELAARARVNLAPWPQVDAVHGNGRMHDPGEVDAIVAFAGSTHPAPLWLDRLAPGGRLLMPLTNEERWGFLLLARRPGDEGPANACEGVGDRDRFDARSIGSVGIFPCMGGRDEEAADRLKNALQALPRGSSFADIPIAAAHRGDPGPDELDRAWYRAPGFWLERKQDEDSATPQ